ncbi:MAG: hypothetical protein ACT4QE_23995 [Anaerolineales bacterium]
MSPQIIQLLTLIPEERHEDFVQRLPRPAVQVIAGLADDVDEGVLQQIAEAVWNSLEFESVSNLD